MNLYNFLFFTLFVYANSTFITKPVINKMCCKIKKYILKKTLKKSIKLIIKSYIKKTIENNPEMLQAENISFLFL